MTEAEAIAILHDLYEHAPRDKQVLGILLFGVKYADELAGHSLASIASQATGKAHYAGEIKHGMNLAEYVMLTRPLWREQRSR